MCLRGARVVLWLFLGSIFSPGAPAAYADDKVALATEQVNRQALQIVFKHDTLGSINAYINRGSVLLPLGKMSEHMGFPIFVDAERGIAEGWFIQPDKTFRLDMAEHRITIAGKDKTYPDNLAVIEGDDIYIDSSVLSDVLHLIFQVDHSNERLKIILPETLPDAEKQAIRAAMGKKQEDVIRQAHIQEEHRAALSDAQDEIASEITDDTFTDENLLVLQPVLEKQQLDEFIDGYAVGGHYFLPLDGLATLLEFPIQVHVKEGKAEGWFLDETHEFSLDMAGKKARVQGKTYHLKHGDAVIVDGDIYIRKGLLETWFPVQFAIDQHTMNLNIHATAMLPFQLRQEREKQKDILARKKALEGAQKEYPLIEPPYSLYSMPFMDFSLSHNYHNSGDHQVTDYSIQAGGDFGLLSTEIFASGATDTELVNNVRVKGTRADEDGNLLGGLHAKEFAVGDIDSQTVPLVAQTSLGRGVSFTNRSPSQSAQFDVTSFTGNSLPGWEIELYRNDALLDFQVVGSDGRYAFIDVPVLYGSNTFRLVFYGPQGQIQEQVKQLYAQDSALKEGQFIYDVSLDEKSKSLLGISDLTPTHPDGLRSIAQVEYGVTDHLSLSAGTVQTPIEDGMHSYMTTGLKTSLGNIFLGADAAYDVMDTGWAAKWTALTSIEDISLKLEQRFFNDFVSEEENPLGTPHKSFSEADVNSFRTLPLIKDINIGLNLRYEEFVGGVKETTITNRLSKSFWGVNISHDLGVVYGDEDRVQGNIGLRGFFWKTLIGTQVDYRVAPEKTIDRVNLTLQRNLTQKINTRLGFTKNLGIDDRADVNGSLNWDFDTYRLSTQMDVDDDNNVFVGLGINISIGKIPGRQDWQVQSNPLSYSGAVMAHAFVDNNYDKIFDEGDEEVAEAPFVIGNTDVKAKDGYAFGDKIFPYQKTNVTLNKDLLEDPLWMPGVDGYTVLSRPGVVVPLEFPIFVTSEIDGTVYVSDEEGSEKALKNVTVQLIDTAGKVVKTVKTEFDGYYILEKVLPGSYTLTVAPEDLERLALQVRLPEQVDVGKEGDFYNGYDLRLDTSPQGQ